MINRETISFDFVDACMRRHGDISQSNPREKTIPSRLRPVIWRDDVVDATRFSVATGSRFRRDLRQLPNVTSGRGWQGRLDEILMETWLLERINFDKFWFWKFRARAFGATLDDKFWFGKFRARPPLDRDGKFSVISQNNLRFLFFPSRLRPVIWRDGDGDGDGDGTETRRDVATYACFGFCENLKRKKLRINRIPKRTWFYCNVSAWPESGILNIVRKFSKHLGCISLLAQPNLGRFRFLSSYPVQRDGTITKNANLVLIWFCAWSSPFLRFQAEK